MPSISIRNLSHRYKGGTIALQDVNLEVESGMFGLLGPNGAGKTTLMRSLVTLLKPTSGQVFIDGLDLQKNRKEIRRRTGYLPQDFSDFAKLSAWEFLEYSACLRGIQPKATRRKMIEKALEDVGLFEARDRKASKLSGGMKRRLGIAQTLLGDPRILVIDEPTVGLDPEERIRFRNLLSDLSREDKIILLSTHIVGDISSTCARIALLLEGRVVFDGPPEALASRARGKVWKTMVPSLDLDGFKQKYPVISAVPDETGFQIRFVADRDASGFAETVDPNLEDAYVVFMMEANGRTDWEGEPSAFETGVLS